MRVSWFFSLYDFWVGLAWYEARRTLYVLLLPGCGFKIEFSDHREQRYTEIPDNLLSQMPVWDENQVECYHCGHKHIAIHPFWVNVVECPNCGRMESYIP